MSLLTPVEDLPGVRAREAVILRSMGLKCLAHLLNHLPHRHEYEAAEAPVEQLHAGQVISTRGEVTACRVVRRGKPRFEAVLLDHTGRIDLVWFNQTFLANTIHPGVRLRVQGKAKRRGGGLQLVNPRYQVLRDSAPEPAATQDRFRPVYPATEDLPSERLEKIIGSVLTAGLPLIEDHLPEAFRKERQLPELAEAYRMMHAPRDEDEATAARRRLAYDEFLLLQLGVHLRRAHLKRRHHAPALRWTDAIDRHIRARLPFELTPAQETVIREVANDLTKTTPANRLIQGDVGAGKTVIALYAMLIAVANKRQAALMAPTELLSEQHFAGVSRLLSGSDVRVELLTGSLGPDERSAALRRIASGDSHLVIGTHALLTEGVSFADLAVAVIDEQHRFGVHQRAQLREKSSDPAGVPHTLVMTATPIPRTLSLTIFGDL
ncbi:MAG: DEAD/DEAH box helicase, partial [Armatimonadetes bacterium]|nr:DEAD/DEAH box helicase [Armatimonadota bacterium]